MGRLMAIDYGLKRVGIAVTDYSIIISSPLTTVPTSSIFKFLDEYFKKEKVDKIIIGDPVVYGSEISIKDEISCFVNELKSIYKDKEIIQYSERYTSNIAKQYILLSGVSKKRRRDKRLVDMVSASIILQSYIYSEKKSTQLTK